jgi:hypothetical protein
MNKNNSSNNSNTNNQITSESLIDLNSYESQKTNQIKQLTDSISNVYSKPAENNLNQFGSQSNGYIQMNQPSINIQNTYYNYGMNNNYNQQFANQNLMNQFPNNINNGYMPINYGATMGNISSRAMQVSNMGMNTMGMNNIAMTSMGMNNVNLASLSSLSSRGPSVNNPTTIVNEQQFNYDYYNNIKSNPQQNLSSSSFYDLGGSQHNPNNYNTPNSSSTNKRNDDPFKNLFSFK